MSHRRDHAAGEDDRGKPGQVGAAKRRLAARRARPASEDQKAGKAEAGAEIKQRGEQPRRDVGEQKLCEGCAGAEERGSAQRQRRAGRDDAAVAADGPPPQSY
jgi:hypothetical protein